MHHRWSDTERDPHSPKHSGILKTYWWSSGDSSVVRYIPDLLRKPLYVFQHNHYFKVLIALHILGALTLPLVLYWALLVAPAFLMWFAGSMTNVFGHDAVGPRNSTLLGLAFAGEGWHKNHHDNAASTQFHPTLDWGGKIYNWIK
jgi:fatty-acid desaturase